MSRTFLKNLVVFLTVILSAASLQAANAKVKYVFLFIGDGMSTPQRMIAEEFSQKTGRGYLAINHMQNHATTRTASANALITDSAAAATAIACGAKTYNGGVGVDANKNPIESTAEVAKKAGKKVGIISSVTLNHATPAGFYGHKPSRSMYYLLSLDLIASGFDFFGGGGLQDAFNTKANGYKGDFFTLAEKADYQIVIGGEAVRNFKYNGGKVIAVDSKTGSLPKAIDRPASSPALAEFVELGIKVLDNPNGFFMMAEGGQIDWDGHANRSAENLREVLDFDDAVKVALKFAEKHPDETLIVVTGDHETGGMTLGLTGQAFASHNLSSQKCSSSAFAGIWKKEKAANPDMTMDEAKEIIHKYYGLVFEKNSKNPMAVNDEQLKLIEKGIKEGNLHEYLRRIMNIKGGIGWTSTNHTALPVLTTATGVNSEKFNGFIDNTDIAKILKPMM